MSRERQAWKLIEPGKPLALIEDEVRAPAAGEAVIQIAACGFCHTDLSFIEGAVKPRAPLPLVLGHEIAGVVEEVGGGEEDWVGKRVIAAAVIPCGECELCRCGRGNVCQKQIMPGSDCDGGFATRVVLPLRGLYPIEDLPQGFDLTEFAVIADAVSTALAAVERAGVVEGDAVMVVGAGGVGGYVAQIAARRGARVIAIDVDQRRLAPLTEHGVPTAIDASGLDPKGLREKVREAARSLELPRHGWKVFECSGTVPGQESAYSLLGPAGVLAIVGYTRDPARIRLSNLMAFDATAFGSWGCPPELYPEAVRLVSSGEVAVKPFVRNVPMSELGSIIGEAHSSDRDPRRPVLCNSPME